MAETDTLFRAASLRGVGCSDTRLHVVRLTSLSALWDCGLIGAPVCIEFVMHCQLGATYTIPDCQTDGDMEPTSPPVTNHIPSSQLRPSPGVQTKQRSPSREVPT